MTVIQVESLGKRYRLRHQANPRYRSLRETIGSRARKILMLGSAQTSERSKTTEEFWALRAVSFAVSQGEVIGIIGRNGAGKSTLLKILSRITDPSEGRVRIRGRVASLLEVGTGFHPELTGRENIFLNGVILGMTRAEVTHRFDEIVAFAEIERFLDTAVKHYSSGMYVRLAFAVAAHLDPEILVVDEVLAVGDIEFQKKCLGKMRDVGTSGRTVLFVSHNMAAVRSLTNRAIVLSAGQKAFEGSSDEAVAFYTDQPKVSDSTLATSRWGSGAHTTIKKVGIRDRTGKLTDRYSPGEPIIVAIEFTTDGHPGLSLEIFLFDGARNPIGLASLHHFAGETLPRAAGTYSCEWELSPLPLASGSYWLDVATSVVNSDWDHLVESALTFDVAFSNPSNLAWDFRQSFGYGSIAITGPEKPRFAASQRLR